VSGVPPQADQVSEYNDSAIGNLGIKELKAG
jgi:hypothetical protein